MKLNYYILLNNFSRVQRSRHQNLTNMPAFLFSSDFYMHSLQYNSIGGILFTQKN